MNRFNKKLRPPAIFNSETASGCRLKFEFKVEEDENTKIVALRRLGHLCTFG